MIWAVLAVSVGNFVLIAVHISNEKIIIALRKRVAELESK